MNERMKLIRKKLRLTQEKFAERIGLKQNTIALIESGKRNMSDQAILSVCREFGVNEEWLRTGEGEMFARKSSSLDDLARNSGLTTNERILIEKFMNLRPETRRELLDYIKAVADAMEAGDTPEDKLTEEEALYKEACESASSTQIASA